MRSAAASPRSPTTAEIGSPVPLERLLGGIDVLRAQGDFGAAIVRGVTHDSRAVRPGTLFCCLRGRRSDGHHHASAAVEAGAVALLCEELLPLAVPQAVVADARAAMAPVAAAFFDHPSRHLTVAGITGTNGKTTATHLLQAIFAAAGRSAAVIGTLSGVHTTPEAPELQARLAELAAEGTDAVAMEVSSEALAQHRVDATWFEVVAFTNLSQDHLNFHGTMDAYFAAKASLFFPDRARFAVVNADDPWGRTLVQLAGERGLPVRPVGLADAIDLELGRDGSRFRWDGVPVRLRLPALFNVVNAVVAAAVARELGIERDAIAAGLGELVSVRGRFERVDGGGPVPVIVDYAHTPAGLESVLTAARQVAADGGRVLVVFGAGGDRDHDKRPAMGQVATRFADVAVLTTDNPRSEDPLAIIEDVRAGVGADGAGALVVEPDRRAAIRRALEMARAGDAVVIAGKGHEQVQTFAGGRTVPFDDREVAREELRDR
jgi:UDP-N-acetylmuramoyl-L-alanyl-D-glutamate--2,6-diaminopimelate ligase